MIKKERKKKGKIIRTGLFADNFVKQSEKKVNSDS